MLVSQHEPRADVLPRDQHADARRGRRHDRRRRARRAGPRGPGPGGQADPDGAEPAQERASNAGGWRYQPTSRDSDISVTGWQVMALRAAKVGRVRGPLREHRPRRRLPQAMRRRRKAAGSATSPAARRTTPGPAPASSPWKSAASTSPPRPSPAPSTCSSTRPSGRATYFFYEVYYCPLAMFQMGDKYFLAYYPKLVAILLDHQDRTGAGSPATATTAPAAGTTARRWPCWRWRSSIGICRSIRDNPVGTFSSIFAGLKPRIQEAARRYAGAPK